MCSSLQQGHARRSRLCFDKSWRLLLHCCLRVCGEHESTSLEVKNAWLAWLFVQTTLFLSLFLSFSLSLLLSFSPSLFLFLFLFLSLFQQDLPNKCKSHRNMRHANLKEKAQAIRQSTKCQREIFLPASLAPGPREPAGWEPAAICSDSAADEVPSVAPGKCYAKTIWT